MTSDLCWSNDVNTEKWTTSLTQRYLVILLILKSGKWQITQKTWIPRCGFFLNLVTSGLGSHLGRLREDSLPR